MTNFVPTVDSNKRYEEELKRFRTKCKQMPTPNLMINWECEKHNPHSFFHEPIAFEMFCRGLLEEQAT